MIVDNPLLSMYIKSKMIFGLVCLPCFSPNLCKVWFLFDFGISYLLIWYNWSILCYIVRYHFCVIRCRWTICLLVSFLCRGFSASNWAMSFVIFGGLDSGLGCPVDHVTLYLFPSFFYLPFLFSPYTMICGISGGSTRPVYLSLLARAS